ncbi:MAG: hypothetical protein HIU82_21835, partial [Proteobacteria bacterium]|nr:hypothetical protein [Pseudomonadota bacterium]
MLKLNASTDVAGLTPAARNTLRHLVSLFGLIWLINAGFQASAWLWEPDHRGSAALLAVFTKAIKAAPGWLRPLLIGITSAVRGIGPHWVALGMVLIALLLGLALISRIGLVAACWLGIAYSLVCWVALCALGYPYAGGQTDPGVFPAYVIAFVFVLSIIPTISGPALVPRVGLWTAGRLLFGLLWAFDAVLKWMPYFLNHFLDQLAPAAQGQPAWIAGYIGLIILVVKAVGPLLVAVVIALVETAIAVSLLTGRWLILSVPLGFLYALAVWTSAEGFGGPYSRAGTGVRGNVLGNVLIYAVVFLIMLVP